MKILHLVSQDSGGAGRAALRVHQALLDKNIESIMLVQQKTTDKPKVTRLAKTNFQKIIEKIRPLLPSLFLLPYTHNDIFSPNAPSNRHLLKTIASLRPDLIHLHWINNGFLNIADLAKLNIPMLWSLHDANPYTGGCHVIPNHCEKFKTHCQKCPLLHSNFTYDLSYFTFNKKAKIYPKLNITINALSKWITSCAKESMLLKDKSIINLPNCIDTKLYQPIKKILARELLNIELSKKIIAFGAINPMSIQRKGYHELKKALKLLKNKENIKLIIFGSAQGEDIEGIQTLYLGHLNDDISLKILYSACDVFITPSLAENLSNVIMESLACGTPVVGFDIGGNSDMIEHKTNGYLAKDYEDLASGIEWILNLEKNNYEILCENARKKVCSEFDSDKVSLRYIKAYEKILNA
ncbi:glycosyltransferase [Helicobacter cappadocius]|uniref:Glycosyltransferase n=1 Tax=Helicobacter cappadocius TaxID=3063998 RepID=A0AA90TFM8_9HELI|nr:MULTISPECIES: glycosyltransferase [unclassified Helicobacter]MDO7253872.1 glycosyltransferase [Helicobacter sp. faydin-H75]MDP2539810.1 glycosyltransferase [Helicobacter sp. faydin-H76]